MDIVVTIPKNRAEEVHEEQKDMDAACKRGESIRCFWSVRCIPKKLKRGQKCFFVWDDAIRGYHVVSDFGANMECDFTGRFYAGSCIVLHPRLNKIKPIPMKGFRGYQYMRKAYEKNDKA